MDINIIAFYKARFGEIEYYDVKKHLSEKDIKLKLKEIAEHLKNNKGSLHMAISAEIDYAEQLLEEIRNCSR